MSPNNRFEPEYARALELSRNPDPFWCSAAPVLCVTNSFPNLNRRDRVRVQNTQLRSIKAPVQRGTRMIFLFFNLAGFLILLFGFALAFMGAAGFGRTDWPLILVIAGIIISVLDLGYRYSQTPKYWFDANRGGMLFFLPIWFFGIGCLVLGALDLAGMR